MTPRTFVVRSADIARCPIHSLLPEHYLDDGACLCPTVDEARAELAATLADVRADQGDAMPDEGSVVADLLHGLALDWPAAVAAEVCRMELGWVPYGLRQSRPDIAAIEDGQGWLA